MSYVYLRLLIFLPAILIPAIFFVSLLHWFQQSSSSLAFHMIYSAYNITLLYIRQYTTLTYSFPNLEPVYCPMSSSNCCFLIYTQISQEAGKVYVWYSHLFKNFPQFVVIHTVKGFSIVNKAEVDVFLQFPCFFDEPKDVGNLISGSSAFSKSSLNIWKSMVHILWTLIWRILSIFLLACAAAAAKSLQLCPTLCDPIDGSPPGSPIPGILQQEHWSGLPFPSPMHESESEVTQSCLTLSNPMDCSLPGFSVHGIFQARVLEWGAIAFSLLACEMNEIVR